jgi:hypothetical protein
VVWKLLPAGDHGLRAPAIWNPNRTVMEEGHVLPLQHSAGFYAMARTDRGYLAAARTASHTGDRGWTPTTLAQYFDNRATREQRAPSAADGGAVPVLRPLRDIVDPVNHQVP